MPPVIRPPRSTPRLALPVPGDMSPADVVGDVGALADRIDTVVSGGGPAGTTLPSAPFDGQVIVYQSAPMATAGVVWQLRYRAAAPAGLGWEFLGGGPLEARTEAETLVAVTGTWVDLTAGPALTVPRPGEYMVAYGATAWPDASSGIYLGISGGGVAPGPTSIRVTTASEDFGGVMFHESRRNVNLAGAVLTSQVRGWGTGGISNRTLRALPIRIG